MAEASALPNTPHATAPTPLVSNVQPTPTARPTAAPAISALCFSAQLTAVWKPDLALFQACAHQGPEPLLCFAGAGVAGGSGLDAGWSGAGWAAGSSLGCRAAWHVLSSSQRRNPLGSLMVTGLLLA